MERNAVFISYCHADKSVLDQMKRHFSIFDKKIDIWDDTKILAGEKWRDQIEKALSKAKIAILLISADFLNSKFITEVELPQILKATEEDGATILSLIVKPCLFSEYPEIRQFQALNPPSKTLIQMSESEQEAIFVSLALRVKQLI